MNTMQIRKWPGYVHMPTIALAVAEVDKEDGLIEFWSGAAGGWE